jgi:cyanate permease
LVYFAFGLILSSIPPLVTTIATDLSMTYSEVGIIMGSVILMYIPLSIPIGGIIDRIGQTRMIVVGLLIIGASTILRSFVFSFETLFLVVVLFGFGGPTISVGLAKVIASEFDGKERGLASGIYMTGAIVGSSLALAITNSVILPVMGTWRGIFTFYGSIGLLIAVTWAILARKSSTTEDQMEIIKPITEALRTIMKHRQVWVVTIIGSSSFLVFYGFTGWLPALLEGKGMSSVDAGLLASLPSWLGLLGSVSIPALATSGSRKNIIALLLLIEGVSMVLISATMETFLLASLVMYGITSGAVMPLMLVVLMDLSEVGSEFIGQASGLFFSVGAFMGFLGPILVGSLTDLTSSFLPAAIVLAIIVEVMILFTVILKES